MNDVVTIDTGPLTKARLLVTKKIRQDFTWMRMAQIHHVLESIANDPQLTFDVFRKESSPDGNRDLISELLMDWHPRNAFVIPALRLLDLESINLFDLAGGFEQGQFKHLLFNIGTLHNHLHNLSALEFVASKVSTLNLTFNGGSLINHALFLQFHDFVKVMTEHGLDLNFSDEGGFCANDYLTEKTNPLNHPFDRFRFVIPQDFLREWQAIVIAREHQHSQNVLKASRGL